MHALVCGDKWSVGNVERKYILEDCEILHQLFTLVNVGNCCEKYFVVNNEIVFTNIGFGVMKTINCVLHGSFLFT